MVNPYAISVLTQFAKSARHTVLMIDQMVVERDRMNTSLDAVVAFRDGAFAPGRLAIQFKERCAPFFLLTPEDIGGGFTGIELMELQSWLEQALLPKFDLAAHDWNDLFPPTENPLHTVVRIIRHEEEMQASFNIVDLSLAEACDGLTYINDKALTLASNLKAHLG